MKNISALAAQLFLVTFLIASCIGGLAQQPYFSNSYSTRPGSEFAGSVVQSLDSGFVTVYFFDNPARGFGFLRTDKFGDTVLSRKYIFPFGTRVSLGYNSDALLMTSDNCFVAAGCLLDLASPSPYPSDAYIVKFDLNGDTIKTWTYNGIGNSTLFGLCESRDHSIIACGATDSYGFGANDFWIVQFDSALNFIQDTVFGGAVDDLAATISQTRDNGFILGGRSGGEPTLLKLDSVFQFEWSEIYPNFIATAQAEEMPDSGYVFTCGANIASTLGRPALVRVGSTGVVVWWNYYGFANYTNGFWSAPTISGNHILAAGEVSDSGEYQRGYIVQTNLSGIMNWHREYWLDTMGTEWLSDIEPCFDGGFIAVGITPVDYTGPWLLRIDSLGCEVPGCDGVSVRDNSIESFASVFPNPTGSTVNFVFGNDVQREITLFDSFGHEIFREQSGLSNHVISVSCFAEGIYFYTIIESGEIKGNGRIIVQH